MWKHHAVEWFSGVFEVGWKRGADREATVRDLHAKIGELTVKGGFSVRSGEMSRAKRTSAVDGMGGLSLTRQRALAGVSR